jgi:hypothetical protein
MADIEEQHGGVESFRLWEGIKGFEKDLRRNFEWKPSHGVENSVNLALSKTFIAT